MCFPRKSKMFVIFLGKMQEISALKANINSFGQIFAFPTPGIILMTKNLAQIKVYTYFNIGDAKTLINLS